MPNLKKSNEFFSYLKENKFEEVIQYLDQLEIKTFTEHLQSDEQKLTFWVNVYNSYFQYLALEKASDFAKSWSKFFTLKQISICGANYSFNHIEHHFLRKSKLLYGFGYLNNLFKVQNELEFRVEEVDYRIHFVLNCGASSCPPITALTLDNLPSELQLAEENFILSESNFTGENNTLSTSSIFLYYFGDFGGRNGIIRLHRKYGINPEKKYTRIHYSTFDKSVKLKNYVSV